MNTINAWIGIDISKATFDACVRGENGAYRHHAFDNTVAGFKQFLSWVGEKTLATGCHFCMEATGTYSYALAMYLTEQELVVSVVNPFRTKHSALASGSGNKTDKEDARLLADYCFKEKPKPWLPPTPECQALLTLLRRMDDLQEAMNRETNRLEQPSLHEAVKRSLKSSIRFLKKEMERLQRQIDDHVKQSSQIKESVALLTSIPGIAQTTAVRVLAEMPDVSHFRSAKQAAAYAGLYPREHRSGTSVRKKPRLGKAGNAHLRKALYFPAMTAIRHNPLIMEFYNRLIGRQKTKMAALAACMRKLLMIAYGVLKHRQPFSILGYQPAT